VLLVWNGTCSQMKGKYNQNFHYQIHGGYIYNTSICQVIVLDLQIEIENDTVCVSK
jgi:hypothetical protein